MTGSSNADYYKKIFFLAAGFYFVVGYSNVSYFLPVYYAQIGYTPEAAGLLVSAFFLTSVTVRPFLGLIIPILGFRKVLYAAGLIGVLGSVGVALPGPCFWAALISRAALGLASGSFQVGLATFQAFVFSESARGRAYSLITVGGLLPMMTLVPLADWLLFRNLYSTYILVPLFSSLMALAIIPFIPELSSTVVPRGQGAGSYFRSMAECFKLPAFKVALLAFFLFCLTDATSAFMAGMTRHYGLMASFFLSSNALVGVCVRLFGARLLDRFPRWKLSLPCIVITAGTLFLATINPTETSLVMLGLIFGIGMGFGFPVHVALISDSVPQRLQPQAISTSWFFMGLDFAAVPLLMGALGNSLGPVTAFRHICGFTLILAFCSVFLWKAALKSKASDSDRPSETP